MIARRFFGLSLALTAGLLTGCGGSSSSLGPGADASVSPTGDGGGQDAGVVPESGAGDGGGSSDDASTPEDGGGTDAADAGSCDSLATRADCVACCDNTYAAGYSAFGVAIEECACEPDVCGPIDGGAPDAGAGADAGEFGEGLCVGTCGTTTPPKGDCEKCMLDSLGTTASPGPCHAAVTACESSVSCKRYLACTASCPAK
jgi:hypothetical protein